MPHRRCRAKRCADGGQHAAQRIRIDGLEPVQQQVGETNQQHSGDPRAQRRDAAQPGRALAPSRICQVQRQQRPGKRPPRQLRQIRVQRRLRSAILRCIDEHPRQARIAAADRRYVGAYGNQHILRFQRRAPHRQPDLLPLAGGCAAVRLAPIDQDRDLWQRAIRAPAAQAQRHFGRQTSLRKQQMRLGARPARTAVRPVQIGARLRQIEALRVVEAAHIRSIEPPDIHTVHNR